MRIIHIFFLKTFFFFHLSTTSGKFCRPILTASQLSSTGLIILANYTALDGIITIRSETVIREGLLEFIVEGGYGGDGREGDGMDVALIRVEFTSDAVILSSRYQKGFVGMQHLTLKPRNEMLNSSQILQFLGRLVLAVF